MGAEGERFLATVGGCLVSLPYDMKVLFEAMIEENLDRRAREIAAGTILYLLSRNDAPPQDQPHLAYVDDAILLRLALQTIAARGGEGALDFTRRFPEYYETLEGDLACFRDYLADSFRWLEGKIEAMPRTVYKGKKVADYLNSEEAADFLYEESLAFATDYELDEEVISRVKRAEPIKQHLERRMAEDAKRIA